MNWLYIVGGFLVVLAVALLLGWSEKHLKNRPVVASIIWIGAILILLGYAKGFSRLFLFVLIALSWLEKLPSWVFYVGTAGIVCIVCWYFLSLIGNSLLELLYEFEETRKRMRLMELSLTSRLDAISERLAEGGQDSSSFLSE